MYNKIVKTELVYYQERSDSHVDKEPLYIISN